MVLRNAVPEANCRAAAEAIYDFPGASPAEPEGWYARADIMVPLYQHPAFEAGQVHTAFLVDHAGALAARDPSTEAAAIAAAALADRSVVEAARAVPALHAAMGPWRN